MDSRDSSSLSAAASRDGSSGDEDGIITVTSGLAKDAAEYFRSSRFNECLEVLNQLLQMKPYDPKVIHNIAVVESFRDGCSDPRKLLEVLNKVKKRSEDLAHAAGDQVESSSTGNSVISGSKGSSSTQHQFSANNTTSTAYIDEFDTSVAKLNIAVIFYHLHEYANALTVLEPLYQNIEPIDEMTALQICLLLLDVALASNDAARAADVIQYLEKAFVVGSVIGHGEGGSIAQHQSSNRPMKASSAPNNSTTIDVSTADSNTTTNLSETTLARTLSDDTLDDDSFVNKFGQHLARSSGFQSSNDISRTSADRSAPAVDLKLKLHLYKVRLLLLTRNLKAAKREVKLAMNIAHGDSSTALLLKSQLEYARGNHRKAIKLLMTSTNRTESWMPSIFNNNFACIYHQLKKHHTSTLFFSKALKSSSSLRSEKPLKLLTFSQDKSLLIVYNCGLQYLACGKPVVAAHCFQKASLVFYNRPLLWLRIAECCLLALEKGLLKSPGGPTDEVRLHVIGSGKWRHLLVDDGSLRNRRLDSLEKDNGSLDDDGQMSLSITFARQCLLNALHLVNGFEMKSIKSGPPSAVKDVSSEDSSLHSSNLNHNNLSSGDSKTSNVGLASSQASANGDAKDPKGGVSPNTTLQSSVSIYEDICRRENNIIKQAILADLAYIELSLENPLKALMAAKSLLRLPECSRIYIFLGHIYAAEALCRLNRLKEAAEHLSVYMNGNNVEFPYSEEDREKFGVDKGGDGEEVNAGSAAPNNLPKEESQGIVFIKPEEARGTLFISLASMFAMQGDLEQAYRFANEALLTIPNNPKAVLMSVYVDLRLGKSQDALAKLKQCSGVRFVPSGLTLNSSS